MNIRSLSNIILPKTNEADSAKKLKSEDTAKDRDPNGQAYQQAEEQEHHNLTEEEVDCAMEYLKNLPGLKQSNLSLSKEFKNNIFVVVVKDPQGKVVRRILPPELYRLSKVDKDQTTGHLLNKKY